MNQPKDSTASIPPDPSSFSNSPPESTSWTLYLCISAALCVGVMCTALVSPLYPIYQATYGFTHSAISYIHVIYVVGVMTSLVFLGNLNTFFGYWTILRAGTALMMVGLALMMLWPTQVGLMCGRFCVGLATGMISTSTLLGMIKTIPSAHANRAPQYSSMISVVGFGLGPLLGGFLAEFLPFPLIIPFVVMIVAGAAVSWQLMLKGRTLDQTKQGRLRFLPEMRLPEPEVHTTFWLISLGAFLAFGIFSFFGSLATSFLHEFLNDAGPLINGASVAAVLLISGAVQFVCKMMSPRKNFLIGLCMLIVSCTALISTIVFDTSILFLLAVILAGLGHGLILVSTFALMHRISTPENKSATLSSFLFIGYFGMVLPIVISGYLSDWFDLNVGVVAFCLMMMAVAIAVLIKTWQRRNVPLNY